MIFEKILPTVCLCIFIQVVQSRRIISRPEPFVPEPPTDCECVPFYRCGNNTVGTGGSVLIDKRFGQHPCTDSVEVCCGNVLPPEEVTTPKPKVSRKKCGHRNDGGLGFKIIGSEDKNAGFAEFPWMVALLEIVTFSEEQHKFFQCGGSLIHDRVVLTAAHCVYNKSSESLIARAGEWDTQTAEEPLPNQDRKISQVIIHEGYKKESLINDVALLITEEPFSFTDNVQIVCLPRSADIQNDEKCIASGWGKDRFGNEGRHQVVLRKLTLPVVEREKCQKQLQETRLGLGFRLHDTFMCAGGVAEEDTCEGDGGGPLICPTGTEPSQYFQVGIVAWGINCGGVTPGVYVNTGKFKNWIDAQMSRLNFDAMYDY